MGAELPPAVGAFVADQVSHLEAFEFVAVAAPAEPFVIMEIARSESGELEVRVPPRMPGNPLPVAARTRLLDAGFKSADAANPLVPWIANADSIDDAIATMVNTLREVLGVEVDESLNLTHGSHRAEHDAAVRLTNLRRCIEPVLAELLGHAAEQDRDGDYLCPFDHAHVVVAPRVIPGAIALVRVFAVTNTGVQVTPELGMLLARLNFGLMFGRFALDSEHRAIWFDETLLGDDVTDRQLRFTIEMIARTASEWSGRLQQMFGGSAPRDGESARDAATKPGTAGYL